MKNPDGWADPLVRPRGVGLRPAMPAFLRASASREDAARNGGMASRRLAPQTGTDACAGFSTLRWQATENDGLPHRRAEPQPKVRGLGRQAGRPGPEGAPTRPQAASLPHRIVAGCEGLMGL